MSQGATHRHYPVPAEFGRSPAETNSFFYPSFPSSASVMPLAVRNSGLSLLFPLSPPPVAVFESVGSMVQFQSGNGRIRQISSPYAALCPLRLSSEASAKEDPR